MLFYCMFCPRSLLSYDEVNLNLDTADITNKYQIKKLNVQIDRNKRVNTFNDFHRPIKGIINSIKY